MAHYRIVNGKAEQVFRVLREPKKVCDWRKLHEGCPVPVPYKREPMPAQPTGVRFAG